MIYVPFKYCCWSLAQLRDVDAIKTSIATSTSPQTYSGADLNGAAVSGGIATARLPQGFCVARSNAAGQYSLLPIVATGLDENGVAATASVTPPHANGNDVLVSVAGLLSVSSIEVPAQAGAGGLLEFGFSDIVFSRARPCVKLLLGADGAAVVRFFDDSLETVTGKTGFTYEGTVARAIWENTTANPLTVFVARSHA